MREDMPCFDPDAAPQEMIGDAKQERQALLPDGIGLSLDQVSLLLKQYNDTVVEKDDPLLLMVTICNAHLAEQEKLFQKHKEAMKSFMGASAREFSVSLASLTGSELAARLERTHRDMIWFTVAMAVLTLANVLVWVLPPVLAGL